MSTPSHHPRSTITPGGIPSISNVPTKGQVVLGNPFKHLKRNKRNTLKEIWNVFFSQV